MLSTILSLGIPVLIGIVILIIIVSGYKKAPPNLAYIISGLGKKRRILIGRAGIRIPFIERLDKLDLQLIPIDVKTATEVPTADYINIKADAAVTIEIDKDNYEALNKAASKFLNQPAEKIGEIAQQVLEGNMREIIGQMHLEEMVTDRKKFSKLVEENAAPDLADMGLKIVSFNVQNFLDKNGVIENLGVDNVVRIQKNAAISRAQSERDIAIEKAKAAKEANDTQVAAQEEIAERNAQLARKKAALKKEVDTQNAQAEAAEAIEAENQRKLRDVAATNANIAKAEREAELKQKQIELKEYELTAMVRKQADADKYAAEQEAAADLVRQQKAAEARAFKVKQDADAEAYRIEQEAKAAKAKADADRYAAEQEAAGIAAKGAAEAEAIEKKAEAQKKMGEASILDMYFDALPQVVANAAAPLTGTTDIHMYGDGNNTKLVRDVMGSANQVMEGIKAATGIDMSDIINGIVGRKSTNQ